MNNSYRVLQDAYFTNTASRCDRFGDCAFPVQILPFFCKKKLDKSGNIYFDVSEKSSQETFFYLVVITLSAVLGGGFLSFWANSTYNSSQVNSTTISNAEQCEQSLGF